MPFRDPEAKRAWRRAYRLAHLDQHRTWGREWYARQPKPERNTDPRPRARKDHALKLHDNRVYRQRRRIHAMWKLGGKCERCGFTDMRALQFDHREPLFRMTRGHRLTDSLAAAGEILRAEKPELIYSLLCANCHVIKTREGSEYSAPRPVDGQASLPLGQRVLGATPALRVSCE